MVEVLGSWTDVDQAGWDALVADGSPFLEYAFLAGLETEGCATPRTGWAPRPVVIRDDHGALVAGAPGWIKTHSMGEFVYDHGWANAAERAGYRYYPKVVAAVPFTPVTGARLLVRPDQDVTQRRRELLAGLARAAPEATAVHLLFDAADECAWADSVGLFPRLQYQFHWTNRGYTSFEDWLRDAFDSKQRNAIRRERKEVASLVTIEVIEAPGTALVDALYGFYTSTCRQFGPWGHVYLTRRFFQHLVDQWGHRLHAVVARRGDEVVGGAFNVRKGDRLYGRYWGCSDVIRFLHFEVCYYAPVAWCIDHGLAVFEPGHGGEHKYRRGFLPVITRSNHRFADPRLHAAFEAHAREEAQVVQAEVAALGG